MVSSKKGQKLTCVPCGREVVVDCCGSSESTLWCCGQPMKAQGRPAPAKKQGKKK